jgi:hypothetical protein
MGCHHAFVRRLVGEASPRWRAPVVVVLTAVAVLLAIVVAQMIRNYPYSAGSPAVRVTVAGGCPQSLGQAVDVNNPGPTWWHELWHRDRLALAGATRGLVCVYGQDVNDAAPTLRWHAVMSADQARAVSSAAHGVSTKRSRGTFHCPAQLFGTVAIVVLGYPSQPDNDIWWDYTGCQTVDNGHVQVSQGANASFGDFQSAVSALVPSAPLPGH